MRNYEVTFIVDPVLSGDEIKATAQAYLDMLQQEGCTIVHTDEMGLRQLAYPIKKRNSGVYYCVEFQSEGGAFIPKVELALSRDERIMRFLTAALDKYGVKFNDDKRKGLIGKGTRKAVAHVEGEGVSTRTAAPVAAPVAAPAPAPVAAPVAGPAPAPIVAAAAPVVAAAAIEAVAPEAPVTPVAASEEE
jgi:small subunit ribosomal protein S6